MRRLRKLLHHLNPHSTTTSNPVRLMFATHHTQDVWAKLDGPWTESTAANCVLPQVRSLDAIHEAYPEATLVLPLLPAAQWVQSISVGNTANSGKGNLRHNLRACNLADIDHPCPAECVDDDEKLAAFYDAHSESIREWVKNHPTHKLVELNVEGLGAGAKLADVTGINASCWGRASCRASCPFWEHSSADGADGSLVPDVPKAFDDGSYHAPQQGQQQEQTPAKLQPSPAPAAQQEYVPTPEEEERRKHEEEAQNAQKEAIEEDQRKREAAAAAVAEAAAQAAVDQQKAQKEALDKSAEDQRAKDEQAAKEQAQKAADAGGASIPVPPPTPSTKDPGYDGTGCKDEKCAKKARTAAEKQMAADAEAAEVQRVAEEEKQMAKDEKERVKEAKEAEIERAKNENEAMKQADIDNSKAAEPSAPITPKDRDPDVVCVSFKEGVNEDWCYAACTNGVCPPDAAKDCMCARGGERKAEPAQQQSAQQSAQGSTAPGTDWASGAKLPTPVVAPSATNPSGLTCTAIGTGVSDSWCQTTCKPPPGGTANCPENLCKCDDKAEVWRLSNAAATMTMASFARF